MTTKTRDMSLIISRATKNLCTTSSKALPAVFKKTQSNHEMSLYKGTLTDVGIAKNMRRLQSAFPKQGKEFFNLLAERLIANGFTDDRLTDAVNNVIDNFRYKELNISDIVQFDNRVKLLSYSQACWFVTERGYACGKEIHRMEVDGNTYWAIQSSHEP